MTLFNEWAARWSIPAAAISDLRDTMGLAQTLHHTEATSEAGVQDRVRLRGAQMGWDLWRNNNGVAEDSRGVPVRFGLANDSAKLNSKIKSADLIGIRPAQITFDMVGCTLGQFVSLEIKKPGWKYKSNAHEDAQARWASIINAAGGHAKFITSEEQIG